MAELQSMSKLQLVAEVQQLEGDKKKLGETIDKIASVLQMVSIVLKPKEGSKGWTFSIWRLFANLTTVIAFIKEIISIIKGEEKIAR